MSTVRMRRAHKGVKMVLVHATQNISVICELQNIPGAAFLDKDTVPDHDVISWTGSHVEISPPVV